MTDSSAATSTTDDADHPVISASDKTGAMNVEKIVRKRFDDRQDMATRNDITTHCTRMYVDALDPEDPPEPRVIEQQLIRLVEGVVISENGKASGAAQKLSAPKSLTCWQIAQILLRIKHVIRIAPNKDDTDREYDLLAMYVSFGRDAGTYTTSEDDIRTTARQYNSDISLNDAKEIEAIMREDSPRTHQCEERDLLAVQNGIVYYGNDPVDLTIGGKQFHFEPKKLHTFDPEIVFMSKPHVSYVEDAPMQIIDHHAPDCDDPARDPHDCGNPGCYRWEVTEWIDELFDQENQQGLSGLIWEIIGAILRPHVAWDKAAWFYSESGSNGKGTLCSMLRNLVGAGSHTSIPLSDFGKNFALEPLVRATAIITDENDVGTMIDKAANLKAVITNDVIQIDRKFRAPIAYQFHGFMIQCLNGLPQAKDKSDSFYRRQLFVPFDKSFTGAERKEIKDDYLKRPKVLEYVLWYAINMAGTETPGNYYTLSAPEATTRVLDEFKEANDPIRYFWNEFRTQLVWGLVPFTFLYDLYKSWFAQNSPSGTPISNKRFITDLLAIIRKDTLWYCEDKSKAVRPGQRMNDPEPLIVEYELKSWFNPTYQGNDTNKRSKPELAANYRGIEKHIGAPAQSATNDKGNQSVTINSTQNITTGDHPHES